VARELDPALFQCPVHGRLAVAFGSFTGSAEEESWSPWCPVDLDLYASRDDFAYVRIGADRDRDDTTTPLKHEPPRADDSP
jgi:hypothetical protein